MLILLIIFLVLYFPIWLADTICAVKYDLRKREEQKKMDEEERERNKDFNDWVKSLYEKEMALKRYKKMYVDFRTEIDRFAAPALFKWANKLGGYQEIKSGKKVIGFLSVIDGYVDGIFVKPRYREQGYAKRAVLDYIKNGGIVKTLHIVNKNEAAKAFWFSLFDMHKIEESPVDTLYYVDGLKNGEIK